MNIYDVFYNLLFVLIAVLFVNGFIPDRNSSGAGNGLFGFLLLVLCTGSQLLFGNNVVFVLSIVIPVGTFQIKAIYKTSIIKAFVLAIYMGLIVLVGYALVLGALLGSGKFDITTLTKSEIVFYFKALVLLVVFLIVAARYIISQKLINTLDFRDMAKVIPVPLITIIAICFIIFGYRDVFSTRTLGLLKVITMTMLGLNVLSYYFLLDISKAKNRSKEMQKIIDENRDNIETYKKLKDNYVRQKKNSHDQAEHMQVLKSLAEKGEYNLLKQYLDDYAAVNSGVCKVSTGNLIVDVVLENKLNEATEKGILMSLSFNDLTGVFVDETDLVTILSNLLSNAIEGCERVKNGRRMIKVNLNQGENLTVSVVNTCREDVKANDKGPISVKEDTENHGLGFGIVNETIKKYNGVIKYSVRNGEFGVVVVI
ncbi:MAG: ATP-binding protein [Lachnospiraceae bacterium]|nr:ATP-binding protein [Lachnospiraceae bacterium]